MSTDTTSPADADGVDGSRDTATGACASADGGSSTSDVPTSIRQSASVSGRSYDIAPHGNSQVGVRRATGFERALRSDHKPTSTDCAARAAGSMGAVAVAKVNSPPKIISAV